MYYKEYMGALLTYKSNDEWQRISIRIEIPRKTGEGTVSFESGWMVYPNGLIQLSTQYGGK